MTRRIEKINELIKRELGSIISREFEVEPGILVTITEAKTSSDLTSAAIGVTVWPEAKRQEVFHKLDRAAGFFQSLLNKKLRMKPIPKISFWLDNRVAEAGKVEELLEKVKNDK